MPTPIRLTPEKIAEIIEEYTTTNISRNALEAKHGLYNGYVAKIMRRAGVPLRDARTRQGEDSPIWRGGRLIDSEGYVRIRLDADDPMIAMTHARRGVLEHRLVMARHLGRPLLPHERVHHINGDKTDNRIQNLEMWENGHPYGQRAADKARIPKDPWPSLTKAEKEAVLRATLSTGFGVQRSKTLLSAERKIHTAIRESLESATPKKPAESSAALF